MAFWEIYTEHFWAIINHDLIKIFGFSAAGILGLFITILLSKADEKRRKIAYRVLIGCVASLILLMIGIPFIQTISAISKKKTIKSELAVEADVEIVPAVYYIWQEGDSFWQIARKFEISYPKLLDLNPQFAKFDEVIKSKYIPPGSVIIISEEGLLKTERRIAEVPFDEEVRNNPDMPKDTMRTLVKGELGEEEIYERVTYVNGVRQGAVQIGDSRLVKTPVNEVREIGQLSEGTKLQIERRTAEVPFEIENIPNPDMPKGTSRTLVEGVAGEEEFYERVTYINGIREDVELVSTPRLLKAPVNEIREVGSKEDLSNPKGAPPYARPSHP